MRSEAFWSYYETVRERLLGRAGTFEKMFEHLDGFDSPVRIIETGCIEDPDNWAGNGCSTILFDKYAETHEGCHVISVEIDPQKAGAASHLCKHVTVLLNDSVAALREIAEGKLFTSFSLVDLLYLDASHLHWNQSATAAHHHLAELLAAMPMIHESTMVAVDDSPLVADDYPFPAVGGKGAYVGDYAISVGADLKFAQYQVGWTGMSRPAVKEDAELKASVERARAAVEAENVPAAGSLYRQIIICTNPPRTGQARVARGEACAFFANMAIMNGKLGTAADWLRRASDADPLAVEYRLDLVHKCFLPIGHVKAALGEAERAAAIAPDHLGVWKILGGVHHEMFQAEKSIEAYDRALAIAPDNPDVLLDRTTIAVDLGDYKTAARLCQRVLNLGRERAADAVHCLAMIAYREHRHEDAIALYDDAIAAGCRDAPIAHWNKSLALHSIGRLKEGWIEHEWREHNKQNPALYLPMRRFKLPRWTGQPPHQIVTIDPAGGIGTDTPALIHVHYEAGAGDNLACARYLRLLRDLGFRVRYETAPEMVDLMRSSFPDVEVVPKAADYPGAVGIDVFDYHIPMGSLPAVFETDIDTVPWAGPYLKPDPVLADRYRAKVAPFDVGGVRKVGVCWSSGIRDGLWIKEYGLRKSMPFEALRPVVGDWNSTGVLTAARLGAPTMFFSLQVGPERRERSTPVVDLLPAKPSWAETAALVANLDLVITVDTGVAHLAGAMGKPTWLMCQRDACSWHFMCWRPGAPWNKASPWYPSMRVFRQREFDRPHFWDDVVMDIAAALRDFDAPAREAAQ